MTSIAALIASVAFLGLVLAVVPALLQIRRTARAAEQTLLAVEREVRPLASQVHGLLQEHRDLAQRLNRDLRELEGVVVAAQEVLARLVRLTGFLGGVGTVGRVIGLAQALRKGANVFIRQLITGRRVR